MNSNHPFGTTDDSTAILQLRMGVIDKLTEISNLYDKSKITGFRLDRTILNSVFDTLETVYGLNPDIHFSDSDSLFSYINRLDIQKLKNLYRFLDDTHQRLQLFPVNESKNMKSKKINKALLSEELKRFKSLTDYNYYDDRNAISENFPIVDMEDKRPDQDPSHSGQQVILGMAEAEGDDNLDADVEDISADIEANQEAPADDANTDAIPDAPNAELPPAEEAPIEEPAPAEDEVELDVTELVKGSEAAKQSADAANSKIEQLMSMVDKLENQLSTMSSISDKIEGLEKEIERRNPTPKEKLEMRSLDSFPYSVKLSDFWAEKGDRYDTGANDDKPNEYVLTQQDVDDDYIETNIENSFDGDEYEEENVN